MRKGSEGCTERSLYVEYARGRLKYGFLFRFSLFYEYSNLEYVHIHVIYRVDWAEYFIRVLVAAPQEYENTYSTCRKRRHKRAVVRNLYRQR